MTYVAQTWADNNPAYPVSAARMAYIEAGIAAVANGGYVPVLSRSSALVRRMADPQVHPNTPTFSATTGDTASITGTLVTNQDARFRFVGGTPFDTTLAIPAGNGGGFMRAPKLSHTTGADAATFFPWGIEFLHEGTRFELYTYLAANGGFRVWIDGEPHAETPYIFAGPSSRGFVKVDFGGYRRRRHIFIEYNDPVVGSGVQLYFGGINIDADATISPPLAVSQARLAIVGDSYTGGSGADHRGRAYGLRMGRRLGFDDVALLGSSGTGFINTNPGGSPPGAKYRDRLPYDLYPYSWDLIIVQGSINDSGQAGLQAEATTTMAEIKAAYPNAKIYLTGVLEPHTWAADRVTINDRLRLAAAASGVTFIDAQTWFSGTGKVGATTGDGPADYYLNNDGVHPTAAGHAHIGDRLAYVIASDIGLPLSAEVKPTVYRPKKPGLFTNQPVGNAVFSVANQFRGGMFVVDTPTLFDRIRYRVVTQSGNIGIAIWTADGLTQLVTTGAFACPAAGNRDATVTETLLMPGVYFAGASADNTTAILVGNTAAQILGSSIVASAHPPPATITVDDGTGSSVVVTLGLWHS